MVRSIRYVCKYELLPEIEAILAANGYTVEIPLQKNVGGYTAMGMKYGTVSILLAHAPKSEWAEIEIWGAAQDAAVHVLESSPIELYKQPDGS